jgi:hypothetical protein
MHLPLIQYYVHSTMKKILPTRKTASRVVSVVIFHEESGKATHFLT